MVYMTVWLNKTLDLLFEKATGLFVRERRTLNAALYVFVLSYSIIVIKNGIGILQSNNTDVEKRFQEYNCTHNTMVDLFQVFTYTL